jgi:hypothetical protein
MKIDDILRLFYLQSYKSGLVFHLFGDTVWQWQDEDKYKFLVV